MIPPYATRTPLRVFFSLGLVTACGLQSACGDRYRRDDATTDAPDASGRDGPQRDGTTTFDVVTDSVLIDVTPAEAPLGDSGTRDVPFDAIMEDRGLDVTPEASPPADAAEDETSLGEVVEDGAVDSSIDRIGPDSAPAVPAVEIAAGAAHSCARLADGTVWCWGRNEFGEVGDGTRTARVAPVRVTAIIAAIGLSAAGYNTCAVLPDRTVRCWGWNGYGQIGDGASGFTATNPTPTTVVGLTSVTQVAASHLHTCALIMDGTARCWGQNTYGQVGMGTVGGNYPTPRVVVGLSSVTSIALGQAHSCARRSDGTAWCWGANDYGNLGTGVTGPPRANAAAVPGLANVVEMAGGRESECALLLDSTMRCWGGNADGQLGDGTFVNHSVPTRPVGVGPAAHLGSNWRHVCAVLSDANGSCWGWDSSGQLGRLSPGRSSPFPQAVWSLADAVEIRGGDEHTCARLNDGSVWCWGDNTAGQLGDGGATVGRIARPVRVVGLGRGP